MSLTAPFSFQKPVKTALAPSQPASGPCPLRKCKREAPFGEPTETEGGGLHFLNDGGGLTGYEPPLGTSQQPTASHIVSSGAILTTTFSFPFPPIFPGNPLQRNLRQMASERQLARTWIPLLTPPSASGTPPTRAFPGHPIPERSHFTLPSYWPPFILSPFLCFENNLKKAHFTVAVGRKQKQVWKNSEHVKAVHLLLSRPSMGAESPRGQRPQGRETDFKEAKVVEVCTPTTWEPLACDWRRQPRGSGREARE